MPDPKQPDQRETTQTHDAVKASGQTYDEIKASGASYGDVKAGDQGSDRPVEDEKES